MTRRERGAPERRLGTSTLAELLDRVAAGLPPPADGLVSVVPPPWPGHHHAVLGFTAHHVVVTDADPAWVHALLPTGDLSAPLNPPFLAALGERSGRWEAAVEVDEAARGRGLGRALATAARHLVPDGEPVWAQIAPANAASVRAFLAAGFSPVGAEALLVEPA